MEHALHMLHSRETEGGGISVCLMDAWIRHTIRHPRRVGRSGFLWSRRLRVCVILAPLSTGL